MFKRNLIFLLVFLTNIILGFSQQADYVSPYKYYVYLGGSGSIFYKSEQPLMRNLHRPWHIFFNTGPHNSFWSFRVSAEVGQVFKQDFVILKSYFISGSLELTTRKLLPKPYVGFIYFGPNYWFSTLEFDNTTYREKDNGFGFDLATGGFWQAARNLRFSLYFLYQSSAVGAKFYAGSINLQPVGVGSYQLLLSVSYNLF